MGRARHVPRTEDHGRLASDGLRMETCTVSAPILEFHGRCQFLSLVSRHGGKVWSRKAQNRKAQSRKAQNRDETPRDAKSRVERSPAITKKTLDRKANGCCIAYKYDYMYEFGQCLLVIRMHMNMTGRTLRL